MAKSYVSAELRRELTIRAKSVCEYCLIHEEDTFAGCEVDHIISEKHDGPTTKENLAYACMPCNRAKGSDIGSITSEAGEFTRFMNPRADIWSDHFALGDVVIGSRTDVGEVTAKILAFNKPDRLSEREELQEQGRYPTPEALAIMDGLRP